MFIAAIFCIPVSAEQYTFSADTTDPSAVYRAYSAFTDGLSNFNDGELLPGEITDVSDKLSPDLWLGRIISGIQNSVPNVFSGILPVFSLVIVMAAANVILPDGDSLKRNFGDLASLVCAVELFAITSELLAGAQNYLNNLCSIMNLFLPVMEGVCLAGGHLTEKTVSGGAILLLTTLLGSFAGKIMAPCVSLLFIFSAVTAACPESKLGGAVAGLRKFIGRLWSIFGIFLSFLLSSQTIIAKAADSLGARTARFALGSFVPMAGGMLAEALSTLQSGMGWIRQSAGIGGIIVIAAFFIPAVIPLVLYKISVSLAASAAEILGASAVSGILGEIRGIIELITGVVTAASLLFLLALMIFSKVQGN